MEAPAVTVVLPVRDARAWIDGCLEAVAALRPPVGGFEVVVVDGCSGDGTAERAAELLAAHGLRGEVVSNRIGTIPANLNEGLRRARGVVVCRVDVRSRPPADYLERVVARLADPAVAVSGGRPNAVAPNAGAVAHGVARAHNNRLVMGMGRYRRAMVSQPVESVYLGGYRTADLRRIGGWDESLEVNEDFDLAQRLSAVGEVWLEVELLTDWYSPPGLAETLARYHRFGRWKAHVWRHGTRPLTRQWLTVAGPLVVAGATVRWVGRGSWVRRGAIALAAGAGGLLAVDHTGETGPPSGPAERAAAVAASAAVGAGWISGVLRGLLTGR